jgi:enterochelin esterase-like enzyme
VSENYLSSCGSLHFRPYVLPEDRRVQGSLTGDIRRHKVPSSILGGEREILVYLPPGYSEADTWRYPLALLQDGQNIFDSESAVFGVEWGVDETAERLIAHQKMAPTILVAIYNSPNRIAEYTPFPDPDHGGGAAPLYKQFLLHELLPFVEERYTVSRLPEERAVIGSSLGGLVSLYLGWTSDAFGKIGALSPSLWWGRRCFLTGMAGGPEPTVRPQIWLDAGTHEVDSDVNGNGVPDLIDDLRTLRAILLAQGYQEDEDLIYREFQGARHDEASWSQRVDELLAYFFPPAQSGRFRH